MQENHWIGVSFGWFAFLLDASSPFVHWYLRSLWVWVRVSGDIDDFLDFHLGAWVSWVDINIRFHDDLFRHILGFLLISFNVVCSGSSIHGLLELVDPTQFFLDWDVESLKNPGNLGEGLLERGQLIGDVVSFGEKASGTDKFRVFDSWKPFVVLVLE